MPVRRSVSRVLFPTIASEKKRGIVGRRPFIWGAGCPNASMRPTRTTARRQGLPNAGDVRKHSPRRRPFLSGLASGGVYRASAVTSTAVGSYRHPFTLTPVLPGRFAFCGTFPEVALAGR